MGKLLQGFFCVVLISFLMIGESGAQVALTNDGPVEVIFSGRDTDIGENRVQVSLENLNRITSVPFPASSEWTTYEHLSSPGQQFYVPLESHYLAVGKMNIPDNEPGETYYGITFTNESRNHFREFDIAFDFLVKNPGLTSYGTLNLYYRINNGEWVRLGGNGIPADMPYSENEQWGSFSVQVSVSDVYLRPGDSIDFHWISETSGPDSLPAPLALQAVELFPGIHQPVQAEKGSLIITEILPGQSHRDTFVEYIELYNPSDAAIPLLGLTLRTDIGEIVIQKNIDIQPYQYAVLSNRGFSKISGASPNYMYSNNILDRNGGMIELVSNETVAAKATFERSEPGKALELTNSTDAVEGYSSLIHFTPAASQIAPGLYGSPGLSGGTSRIFKKKITGEKWHLFSVPGRWIGPLHNNRSPEFLSLPEQLSGSGEPSGGNGPFIFYSQNSEDVTVIHAQEQNTPEETFYSTPVDEHSAFVSIARPKPLPLALIVNESGERAAPFTQVWNHSLQRFDIARSDTAVIDGWTPFLVNSSQADHLRIAAEAPSSSVSDGSRFIHFRVDREDPGTGSAAAGDDAVLGFMDISGNGRFDLPKLVLSPTSQARENFQEYPLLFLSGADSRFEAGSFIHLPYSPAEQVQAHLGFELSSGCSCVLSWTVPETIPAHWTLSLEDTQTGTTVDLRNEQNYPFRSVNRSSTLQSNTERNPMSSASIVPYSPAGNERFRIIIEPSGNNIIRESPEPTEQPHSVQLHQNYPNPFNPTTNIAFYLPERNRVKVGIYNVVGQQVALLIEDDLGAGEHTVTWNASEMPSGIYIVQLETGSSIHTRKITLIK